MKLYYHKTDGGAEYLFDTFIKWSHNGKSGKEGVINDKTKYIVRIDGDIAKDAELTIKEDEDTINISWSIEDVKSFDEKLTDEQAREILQMVKDDHDATIGINWDTIESCIDIYKSKKR